MKGLNVLKKLFLLCSLYTITYLQADALSNILSTNQNALLEYDLQENYAKGKQLRKAWIKPIMLQYGKNYSKQFANQVVDTGSFTVGIDQPIFRSGGIYFAIKYADALEGANKAAITLKKREMIGRAVRLLFEIRQIKYRRKKLKLLIKNDTIKIRQMRDSYEAGLLDSSFLDQAILKKNQDETQLLELEVSMMDMRKNFALLSDENPDTLFLPRLKLISSQIYKGNNLELVRDKLRAKEKKYNAKMTWAKYLPTFSIQGQYNDSDLNPLFGNQSGLKEKYISYGFRISMPIDINMFSDIEASKLAQLKAQTEVLDRVHSIDTSYKLARRKLKILDKKIALSIKDEHLYRRLYKSTKNLVKAGEKTSFDIEMMLHSLEIKKLDKKIYDIEKQIELLGLYTKVESVD